MPWLDAARYADTHGYHIDSLRGMWHWRDWVIGAFNRNLPFDQFVIEQLAGDLLPDATLEQKIASGFNRNHMINFEGGAIAEEYQVEYVVDRVEATSSAFMGLTMGCARCHTHKFDPDHPQGVLPVLRVLQLGAREGARRPTGNAAPVLPLPSPAAAGAARRARRRDRDARRRSTTTVVEPLQAAWEADVADRVRRSTATDRRRTTSSTAASPTSPAATSTGARSPAIRPSIPVRSAAPRRSTATSRSASATSGRSIAPRPFSLAVWLRGRGNLPMAGSRSSTETTSGTVTRWMFDDIVLVGIQRWAARLTVTLAGDAPASAIRIRTRERLTLGDWYHVAMTYDGIGQGRRPAAVSERQACSTTESCATRSPARRGRDAPLRVGSQALGPPFRGQLDDLRLYNRVLTPGEVEQLALHYRARAILSGVTGKRSRDEAPTCATTS